MSDKVHYKVSVVVEKRQFPGAVINFDQPPHVGDEVCFDGRLFQITEVSELMRPSDEFGIVHATCRYVRELT
jgi:hypothetical protein